MEAGTGKHTISMKIAEGSAARPQDNVIIMAIHCGVVSDGAPYDAHQWSNESTVGWFVNTIDGGLGGNGKYRDDMAGEIESDQVLTTQLDTDAGTLKFWVDGKSHGPDYSNGVIGSLRWATTVGRIGNTVEIVPTPELQPWRSWDEHDYAQAEQERELDDLRMWRDEQEEDED